MSLKRGEDEFSGGTDISDAIYFARFTLEWLETGKE